MTYQTAAGARKAFHLKMKSLPFLTAVKEDQLDPDTIEDGVFATIQEGPDQLRNTLIGGEHPVYEMASLVTLDIVTLHKDKDLEAQIRAQVMAALNADYTLGGAVDDVQGSIADNETDREEGAHKARSSSLNLELHYLSLSEVG